MRTSGIARIYYAMCIAHDRPYINPNIYMGSEATIVLQFVYRMCVSCSHNTCCQAAVMLLPWKVISSRSIWLVYTRPIVGELSRLYVDRISTICQMVARWWCVVCVCCRRDLEHTHTHLAHREMIVTHILLFFSLRWSSRLFCLFLPA